MFYNESKHNILALLGKANKGPTMLVNLVCCLHGGGLGNGWMDEWVMWHIIWMNVSYNIDK